MQILHEPAAVPLQQLLHQGLWVHSSNVFSDCRLRCMAWLCAPSQVEGKLLWCWAAAWLSLTFILQAVALFHSLDDDANRIDARLAAALAMGLCKVSQPIHIHR